MENINFDKYQLKAIKTFKNTLLIAGAGAGKTTTILGKIDFLLANGYTEDDILCISFTNASVNDLKNKLNNNIDVFTFHKLSLNILKDYDENIKLCEPNLLLHTINNYLDNIRLYKKKYKKFIKYVNDENHFITLALRFINLFKASSYNEYKFKEIFLKIKKIKNKNKRLELYMNLINIINIYKLYENNLSSALEVDFSDMITKATDIINSQGIVKKYKYIIIDEFQDTSLVRLNLIIAIYKKCNSTIFCVGDDFQSIYRFTGCDLNIFLNFKKYFKNSSVKKLKMTYRNPQQLINIAGNFVMKNKKQMKKTLISHKSLSKPIVLIRKNDITKIIESNANLMVLGRNNNDIFNYLNKDYINKHNINYSTIHRSKGLEADNILLINITNNTNGLPCTVKNDYLIDLLLNDSNENYFEERRLFYVALTRTKNKVFIVYEKENSSSFLKELLKDYKKYIDFYK